MEKKSLRFTTLGFLNDDTKTTKWEWKKKSAVGI